MDIIELLKSDEGLSLHPYLCTSGKWTIGYGHNLVANPIGIHLELLHKYGISPKGAEHILSHDIRSCVNQLDTIDEYQYLDEVRRAVIISMTFALGFHGCLRFMRMWEAIKNTNYNEAAYEILDSAWSHGPSRMRVVKLADMMRSGKWPDSEK